MISADDLRQRVEQFLIERGAQHTKHLQWSLLSHLVGTGRILEQWGQPASTIFAGLIHSVYSTDAFNIRLVALAERDQIRALVGDSAERLAYLFCAILRDQVFNLLAAEVSDDEVNIVIDRFAGSPLRILGSEVRNLGILHLANLVEQSARPNGSPSQWIHWASNIANHLQLAENVPPIFGHCTRIVSREFEERLLRTYEAAWASRNAPSFEALDEAAQDCPWVGEPFVLLGLHALVSGDAAAASQCGARAADLIIEWNCSWDKRLPPDKWLSLAAFLEDSTKLKARDTEFLKSCLSEVVIEHGTDPATVLGRLEAIGALRTQTTLSETPADFDQDEFTILPDRFVEYIDTLKSNATFPRMGSYPRLTSKPFWEASDFELARELEVHADLVIDEYRRIVADAFSPEPEAVNRTGNWDVFFLYERGRRDDARCAMVPQTSRIIAACGGLKTMNGLAYFSKLTPRSSIAPHTGPTNLRLRCHFAIDIPGDCGIKVGGVELAWQAGKCLIFDDSFEHEVWNRSECDRVVLVVDMWHPDLTEDEIALLAGLDRHVQFAAEGLASYWRLNDARRLPALIAST